VAYLSRSLRHGRSICQVPLTKYAVFATTVEVAFRYTLKSGKTGETLWAAKEFLRYTPKHNNSGNPLVDLLASAIQAAVTKAAPNYVPLAQQANWAAVRRLHSGLPAGPYRRNEHGKDETEF